MAYTVIWTEKALKNLKPLPKKTAARIVAAVEKIRDEPRNHVQQLRGSPYFKLRVGGYRSGLPGGRYRQKSPYFKLRVGGYRVILDIRKKVLIVYLGQGREAGECL